MPVIEATPARSARTTLVAGWVMLLLASGLPQIISAELFGQPTSEDTRAVTALVVVVVGLVGTVLARSLRGLRPLLTLLLVLNSCQWLVYTRIDEQLGYPTWLSDPSFAVSMLAEQSLNLMVTAAVLVSLVMMGRRRKDVFLTRGDLAAPVAPIRWMGIGPGQRWNRFGLWLSLAISGGTGVFLVIAGRPDAGVLTRALPFVPAIMLAAALNAFTEEVTYKASFLSVLRGPIGPGHATLMVAAYFGVGHFYGVPYGVVGVLLAGFLGWILARSMVETRGMFWAWFVHFWQDVLIFTFLAVGTITPGG